MHPRAFYFHDFVLQMHRSIVAPRGSSSTSATTRPKPQRPASARLFRPGQSVAADPALESLQSRLELGVFRSQGGCLFPLFPCAPLQRLRRDHQNSIYIRGGDGSGSSNRPDAIVSKGSKEVLGHRTVVAELPGILANEIPAREAHPSDFGEHLFS